MLAIYHPRDVALMFNAQRLNALAEGIKITLTHLQPPRHAAAFGAYFITVDGERLRAQYGDKGVTRPHGKAPRQRKHFLKSFGVKMQMRPAQRITLVQLPQQHGLILHLHHARQHAVTRPEGGTRFAARCHVARMVDPQPRLGTFGKLHIHQVLLMPALAAVVIHAAGETDCWLLPRHNVTAAALVVGAERAVG